MFALFSKPFKGSHNQLPSDLEDDHPRVHTGVHRQMEAPGINNSQSVVMMDRAKNKKSRRRRLSRLFGSDLEDEVTSVVSDNPNLYSRSMSMNTLAGPTSVYTSSKKFDKVESKMQSIQASLSHSVSSHPIGSVALREKESRSSGTPTSHNNHNNHTNHNNSKILQDIPNKDEIEKLRRDIEGKENFIQDLKKRIKMDPGDGQFTAMEERLKQLQLERNKKMERMKEKREVARRIESSENIDERIERAELEYHMEKDQIHLINMEQDIQALQVKLEQHKIRKRLMEGESIYSIAAKEDISYLVTAEIVENLSNLMTLREEGFGLYIAYNDNNSKFNEGDRVIEINGSPVLKIVSEEWDKMRQTSNNPSLVVALRTQTGINQENHRNKDLTGLQDDIVLIQSRLEQKLKEGRNVSSELQLVEEERGNLRSENLRLNHRIFYLEEQVSDLQRSLRQVRDSLSRTLNTEIQDTLKKLDTVGAPLAQTVFQKGSHIAKVAVPVSTTLDGIPDGSSTSTSGVYSVADSDGSISPESANFRARLRTKYMRDRGQTNNNRWSVGPVADSDYNQVSRLVVTDQHSSDNTQQNHQNHQNQQNHQNHQNHQNQQNHQNIPVTGKSKTAPTKPTRQLTTSTLPSADSSGERNSQSNGSQSSAKMYKTHSHAHFNSSLAQEKQQRERSVTRKSSQIQRSSSRVSSASSLVRWPFHKVKGLGSNLSLNAAAKGDKI